MTSDFKTLATSDSKEDSAPTRYRLECPECEASLTRARDSKYVKQTRQGDRYCSRCEVDLILTKDAKGPQDDFVAQIVKGLEVDDRVTVELDEYGSHRADIGEVEGFDGGYLY